MRVTNKIMAEAVTGNLFKNIEQFYETQSTISSGKIINKPSDDPLGVGRVLDYRKTLGAIDQYNKNIAHGESWLNVTDSALNTVGDLLIRAKELTLSQADASGNADSRGVAAEEVKNLYDNLLQLANTKLGESYIFAGHKTDTTPFSRDNDYNVTYNGDAEVTDITCGAAAAGSGGKYFTLSSPSTDYYVWYDLDDNPTDPGVAGTGIEVDIATGDTADDVAAATASAINAVTGLGAVSSAAIVTVTNADDGAATDAADGDTGFPLFETTTQGTDGHIGEINIIVGEGVEIGINANGEELFLSAVNIFDVLKDLKVGLETDNSAAIFDQIDLLDDAHNQILAVRAREGTKYNRLEATENHWADFKLNIEQMLSDTEDVDMIKAAIDLASQEAAYQASLAAAAKIIQPSLINFLR